MEQKATQEKMIAEYRTWFAIFLKCLSEIKVDAQIKAEYTEEYRHKLTAVSYTHLTLPTTPYV